MGDRLESRNVLYPFTPAAETNREALSAFLDALIVIGPAGFSGAASGRMVFLKRATSQEVVFGVVCEKGQREMSFPAPDASIHLQALRGNSPDGSSVLVADGTRYVTGVFASPVHAELEPARVLWLPERLEDVTFANTKSCVDPADPLNGTDALPFITVDGDLAFEDGYNTSVSYDEASGTLYFQGGAGFGLGKPSSIPWACGDAASREGLVSVNGISENLGDVRIAASESLTLTQIEGVITIGRSA